MPSRSMRDERVVVVRLTTAVATTPAIFLGAYGGAILITPAGYTSIAATVYSAANETDTFVPLKDSAGAAITLTVSASSAIVLPSAVTNARWIKLVTGADDSALDVSVVMKS